MKKLMLAVVFFAFITSGCNVSRVAGVGTNAPSDPKKEVVEASRKLIALKSVTGQIDANGPTPFKQKVEYSAPGRYRVSYRDASGADLEMVMDGEKSYVKDGDKWNEMATDVNPAPTMRNSFTDEVLNTVSDVRYEGEETVAGKPTLVYSYRLVTKVGSFPVIQKIWVSKSTGLPIKCYVEYTEGSISSLTTTFDTDTPVTIDLPSK